jgi:putative transposase
MKALKFTHKKAFMMGQCEEGTPVAAICRKRRSAKLTYFNWIEIRWRLVPSDMKRARGTEQPLEADGCKSFGG